VMSVDQRDAWVRAYLEDVFNGHNLQSLDKYMTANLVSHWLGDRSLHGPEAWREAMANFFDAFPDAAYTLHDLFFSADKACGEEPGTPRSARSGKEFRQPAARRSGP
jgi:predicted ester cyclase